MAQCLQALATAQVGDFQGLDLVSLPGHQIHLHFPLGPQEEKLTVRQQFFQPAGHSKGRIDMSGGTAAGEDKFHKRIPFSVYVTGQAPGRR